MGIFLILKLVNVITPIRVDFADETRGLDSSQHAEAIDAHVAMKYGRKEAEHILEREKEA